MECTKEITCLQNLTVQVSKLGDIISKMHEQHVKEVDELRTSILSLQKQNQMLFEYINLTFKANGQNHNNKQSTDYQFGIFVLTLILVIVGILHLIPNSFWNAIIDRVYRGARNRYVLSHSYRRIDPMVHRRRRTSAEEIELSDAASTPREH